MLRLLNRIPAHYPRSVVIAALLWFSALLGMGLAWLCLLTDWQFGYYIVFILIGACALCFMGCVVWSLIERLTGQITPWRGDA